ncbi:unnamed protein product [Clavelina lepadiformis]|uniref:FG-GAP repeat protein n=1 Tax=Clavelina lepadiformis TaxID=159417 RepID=A0ABP0H483_CLALP
MLTGDDDGQAWVLTADSEEQTEWSYSATVIYTQRKGTVGAIAVGDADGDGYAEVFLPSYEEKFIRVMTYLQ